MSTIQMTRTTPVPAPVPSPVRGELRLTRRGRLVVFLVGLTVLLGVGLALAAGSVASPEPGAAEPTTTITVGSGETLWDLAADVAEDGRVREMIGRIERLNSLDSTMLVAGQQLVVPAE